MNRMEMIPFRSLFGSIPNDVIVFDILSRLPLKSLYRFRCVSKLWYSTITDQCFLHSKQKYGLCRSNRRSSLTITFPVYYHPKFSINMTQNIVREAVDFITLPLIKIEPACTYLLLGKYSRKYFWYDSINNLYKILKVLVLTTDDPNEEEFVVQNHVFELGGVSWRRISDTSLHYPITDGVCIDGFVYYKALSSRVEPLVEIVVAFDVVLESFKFIPMPCGESDLQLDVNFVLIQFDGRLAMLDYQRFQYGSSLDMWVLEDSLNLHWVRKSIVFSSHGADIGGGQKLELAAVLRNGETIMVTRNSNKPLYLFDLSLKVASVRTIKIR